MTEMLCIQDGSGCRLGLYVRGSLLIFYSINENYLSILSRLILTRSSTQFPRFYLLVLIWKIYCVIRGLYSECSCSVLFGIAVYMGMLTWKKLAGWTLAIGYIHIHMFSMFDVFAQLCFWLIIPGAISFYIYKLS